MRETLHGMFRACGLTVRRHRSRDEEDRKSRLRYSSLYQKYKDFTMVPRDQFMDNLAIVDRFKHIPGCVVECGVWRGGMSAAMAELDGSGRTYFLFDSFEGLPPAKKEDGREAIEWQTKGDSPYYHDNCRAEEGYAQQAMALAGVKSPEVVRGWFSNTLNITNTGPVAILRLDGDWYEPTIECLNQLYRRVSAEGVIIIDDYYFWDGCSRAVHDYLSKNANPDRIHQTENGVAYIIKDEKIRRSW